MASDSRESSEPPKHDHHAFAQEFRHEFAEIGINVDHYTTTVDPETHRSLHAYDRDLQSFNAPWTDFFESAEDEGREVTREEAVCFAQGLLDEAGLRDAKMHHYRDEMTTSSLCDLLTMPEPQWEADTDHVSEPATPAPEAVKPAEPAPEAAVKPPEPPPEPVKPPEPPPEPAPADADKT